MLPYAFSIAFVASEAVDELIPLQKGKGDQQRHSGSFTQRIILQCKAHTDSFTQGGRRRGSKKFKIHFYLNNNFKKAIIHTKMGEGENLIGAEAK